VSLSGSKTVKIGQWAFFNSICRTAKCFFFTGIMSASGADHYYIGFIVLIL